jgi:hypothetical protein
MDAARVGIGKVGGHLLGVFPAKACQGEFCDDKISKLFLGQ